MKHGSIISPLKSKQQSKQLKHSGSPLPKKAKTLIQLGSLVMASFVLDADGILMVEYLQKGQTVMYYTSLFRQLR